MRIAFPQSAGREENACPQPVEYLFRHVLNAAAFRGFRAERRRLLRDDQISAIEQVSAAVDWSPWCSRTSLKGCIVP